MYRSHETAVLKSWSVRLLKGFFRFTVDGMRLCAITIVAFLCLAHPTNADELDDPYLILHKHYEAIGGLERLKNLTSSYSEGRVRYDDLKGTFKHWEGRPLAYRTEEDYTIIRQVEGDSGKEGWFLDTNGQLLVLKDPDTKKRRRIRELLDSYEHLNPNSPYFSLHLAGISAVDERPCYEVVMKNTINSDTSHFFFETDSLRMIRSVSHQPDVTVISKYSDFRVIDGMVVSFYAYSQFLPWEREEEVWTEKYLVDVPLDAALFALPKPHPGYHFLTDTDSVSVDFDFIGDLIYLPVTIAGDTRFWVLDSGATMSVIDADYARSLGLTSEGNISGYGFGELFKLGFAAVPEYRVGDIVFESQKFYVSDGLTDKSYEPVISGIIGYDFLSRFVVEIDYDNARVTFHKPESFTYSGPGEVINAPLKYRTFTLPVVLDASYASRWSVDLGSYHSSIHYPFAEQNGLLNKPGVDTVSQGMSGISREITTQFNCLRIQGFQLDDHLVSYPIEKGKGATALGEVGGNLGNSTLRHFHLFLDYPRQQLILEKGRSFNINLSRDKSGLLIGRSETNHPMVSFLASDSPALNAGLESGDIILKMDDIDVSAGDPIMPLRSRLRGEAGTVIKMKVLRQDQVIGIDLVLANLFPERTEPCPEP